jgi:hypothetical protein
MSATPRTATTARQIYGACDRFVRDYTAGLRARDLRRLFEHDAADAYGVLTRDAGDRPEP